MGPPPTGKTVVQNPNHLPLARSSLLQPLSMPIQPKCSSVALHPVFEEACLLLCMHATRRVVPSGRCLSWGLGCDHAITQISLLCCRLH